MIGKLESKLQENMGIYLYSQMYSKSLEYSKHLINFCWNNEKSCKAYSHLNTPEAPETKTE